MRPYLFSLRALSPESTYHSTGPRLVHLLTNMAQTEQQLITLGLGYDRILLVGTSHPHGQQRFLVSTWILERASPVWRVMFGGTFRESSQYLTTFPEDSAYAFRIVLQITHLRLQDLPYTMSLENLKEFATFCDKYDLVRAVACHVHTYWLYDRPTCIEDSLQLCDWARFQRLCDWAYVYHIFKLRRYVDCAVNGLAMYLGESRTWEGEVEAEFGPELPEPELDPIVGT